MEVADVHLPVPATEPDTVLRTFDACGAVHVSQVLPAAARLAIRHASEDVFRSFAAMAARDALPAELKAAHERRFVPLSMLTAAAAELEGIVHPVVRALAARYLEKEPEVAPDSHVRWIGPGRPDAHLPFHQDQTILNRRLLNVWIALDDCGVDAPGLELVTGSWRALLPPSPPAEPRFAVERAQLEPETVLGTFGSDALWRPAFAAGDAMLFSGATVHRTYATAEMTLERMSVELRLY